MFWSKKKTQRQKAEASVRLRDPGLSGEHLTQRGHILLTNTVTCYVYGPGSLRECYEYCASIMPVLAHSEGLDPGFGTIRRPEGQIIWVGYEGPSDSVLAFCLMPDSDSMFFVQNVVNPVESVREPWVGGKAYLLDFPERVARIIDGNHATPVWRIPGLERLRTPDAPAPLPIALYEQAVKRFGADAPGLECRPGRLVALPDPGLSEGDLDQDVHRLLSACGLTLLVFGPRSLEECYRACREAAPVLGQVASPSDALARSTGLAGVAWLGFRSAAGSALVCFITEKTDVGDLNRLLADPLNELGEPWTVDYAALGARVPEEAVPFLEYGRGHAVPAWEILA